jgi:CRP/FNR family transcriptional regulator
VKPLPLHRLNEFIRLDRSEAKAFAGLAVERRRHNRHDIIRSQGDPADHVYFLVEGWVACRLETADGGHQIVKVHLPGDVLGAASLALTHAAESLVALNPTSIDVIPSNRLGELFGRSPRLAAAMFLAAQQERIWLMDRLMSIGRTSAAQRLAAFLVSIYERLSKIAPLETPSFDLPLSQNELADVLGITTVHANRTLRQLEQAGMISRSGRSVTLEDVDALCSFSGVPKREFKSIPGWVKSLRQQALVQA